MKIVSTKVPDNLVPLPWFDIPLNIPVRVLRVVFGVMGCLVSILFTTSVVAKNELKISNY